MKILVINVGSTSLKYDLYEMDTEDRLAHGTIERAGTVESAVAGIVEQLHDKLAGLAAIGHRVVHGGERLIHPVQIDEAVEATIAECAVFAPLHNPVSLEGIRAARKAFPEHPADRGVRYGISCRDAAALVSVRRAVRPLSRARCSSLRLPRPEPSIHGRMRGRSSTRISRDCGS